MNYDAVRKLAKDGIDFFADPMLGGGECTLIRGGGVKMVNGVEVVQPQETFVIRGVIRDVHSRDVNGDTIRAEDKRGIFTYQEVIDKGNWMLIEGVKYEVVDPRPIKPCGAVVAYRPILRRVAVYG